MFMRFSRIKVLVFFASLIGVFCAFLTRFASVAVAISAVLAFIIAYMMALYCIKQWQGYTLKNSIRDYVEFVPPEVASRVEPYTRGLLIFGDLRLFSRVGVSSKGIYLYKQGCYSCRIPWDFVLACKKQSEFNAVELTLREGGENRFLLPWSSEFDSYFG